MSAQSGRTFFIIKNGWTSTAQGQLSDEDVAIAAAVDTSVVLTLMQG